MFSLFSFYKLRLLLQRTQHTGGKFTERVLPRRCRDQILPRCIVCEYNYIPLHRRSRHQGCCCRGTSVCPLSSLFMSSSSSLDWKRKQGQSSFQQPPGYNTRKYKFLVVSLSFCCLRMAAESSLIDEGEAFGCGIVASFTAASDLQLPGRCSKNVRKR